MVCTRTGEWSCNKDLGFLVTHSKYHEITLPASYKGKSGNFTCETQSVESDAHPCQWPPPGMNNKLCRCTQVFLSTSVQELSS